MRGEVGEITLETDEPSHQRLVAPRVEALDREVLRDLVDAVAAHKGVTRGEVLTSMLVPPKDMKQEWWRAAMKKSRLPPLPWGPGEPGL